MSIKKNQNKKNEILSVRVSKVMKNKWIKFAEKHGYTRLSLFIRDLINDYIAGKLIHVDNNFNKKKKSILQQITEKNTKTYEIMETQTKILKIIGKRLNQRQE